MINVRTFDKKKGKEVRSGYIEVDSFFRKVNSKHFMVKYSGYGLQEDVLTRLLSAGVKYINITTHRGTSYKSKVFEWIKYGKKDDFGHGGQFFLSVKYML